MVRSLHSSERLFSLWSSIKYGWMSPISESMCDLFWFFSLRMPINWLISPLLFRNSLIYSFATCTIADIRLAALPTKSESCSLWISISLTHREKTGSIIAAIEGPIERTQFSKHSIRGSIFLSVSAKLCHFLLNIWMTVYEQDSRLVVIAKVPKQS